MLKKRTPKSVAAALGTTFAIAVPHVASSLRRFGWQQPIVARPSGEVVAGNTRLKAAQELGMTEVPVWWFEGDDLEATAFSIADNRSHEHSEWHEEELVALLEVLREEDALEGVGYSEDDLDALVQQLRDQEVEERGSPTETCATQTTDVASRPCSR